MAKIWLTALTAAFLLAGCCTQNSAKFSSADDYQLTILGDIHFDGEQYHISEPWGEVAAKERQRNIGQWKGASQQLLAAAAAQSSADTPFIIQLGDITQGDCDNETLQSAAFKDVFAMLKKTFPGKKILAVTGNHDVRGNADAPESAQKTLVPLLKAESGIKNMCGTNYAVRLGKDLFIFYDSFNSPSTDVTEKALKNNRDARYVFFISHLPMFPCSNGNPGWIVPDFEKLIPLLKKHNAVVLAAHTHRFSHIVHSDSNGVLPQLIVSSMGSTWRPDGKLVPNYKSFQQWKESIAKRYHSIKWSMDNVAKFKSDDFITYDTFGAAPSGFVKLNVTDKEVTANFYTDNSGKPAFVKTLLKNAKPEK